MLGNNNKTFLRTSHYLQIKVGYKKLKSLLLVMHQTPSDKLRSFFHIIIEVTFLMTYFSLIVIKRQPCSKHSTEKPKLLLNLTHRQTHTHHFPLFKKNHNMYVPPHQNLCMSISSLFLLFLNK